MAKYAIMILKQVFTKSFGLFTPTHPQDKITLIDKIMTQYDFWPESVEGNLS